MIDLNKKAIEIFEQNKTVGWWDDVNWCIYEKLQLVSTEIAEATEGERKNLMDDHLPHRKMGEVEMADALIRLLDLGGRCGWEVKGQNQNYYWLGPNSTAGHHLGCNVAICELAKGVQDNFHPDQLNKLYSEAVNTIIGVCWACGHAGIFAAMDEKLEYNKTRADHKRENRETEHGKRF